MCFSLAAMRPGSVDYTCLTNHDLWNIYAREANVDVEKIDNQLREKSHRPLYALNVPMPKGWQEGLLGRVMLLRFTEFVDTQLVKRKEKFTKEESFNYRWHFMGDESLQRMFLHVEHNLLCRMFYDRVVAIKTKEATLASQPSEGLTKKERFFLSKLQQDISDDLAQAGRYIIYIIATKFGLLRYKEWLKVSATSKQRVKPGVFAGPKS
ncbi:hypothetical protein EIL50_03910 [bacterium NHP-B]|nr:hypothetical protein EIL50_03910 [bacterium NHP-B]